MHLHLKSVLFGILAAYICLCSLPYQQQRTLLSLQELLQLSGLQHSAANTAPLTVSSTISNNSSSSSSSSSRRESTSTINISHVSQHNISHSRRLHSSGLSDPMSAGPARQLLYQGGSFNAAWRQTYSTYKSRWHPTVLSSVFKAQQKLQTSYQERASRLFVPMLSNRHSELCCMLTDLNAKVGGTNLLDVFIFTIDNKAATIYNRSPCWRRKFNITVTFLALDEHWGPDPQCSSSAIHDMDGWIGLPGLFGENYRRMGHWRLAFQFAFADMLGYKYVWQLDDDSYFRTPVAFNMIDYMKQHDLWVAGAKVLPDPHWVTWGLPEITKLFLVGERMAPPGTLFSNHTQPPGLEGLYTVRSDPVRTTQPLQGDEGGWSRSIIHGNCMIIDMDRFWWPKQAQKFVELVLQSGYHWRFRWNEQGVMAMVWQLFVPEGHFQFDTLPIDYIHPRKVWGQCPDPS